MRRKLFLCEDYEVDSNGIVYSKRGKPLKFSVSPSGYAIINIMVGGKRKGVAVHTAILTSFIDKPFSNAQVNHKDGNKLNNRLENLEWVSSKENIQHAITNLGFDPNKNRRKQVKATNVDTGRVIVFPSLREAGRQLKCNPSGIWSCIKGFKKRIKRNKFEYV